MRATLLAALTCGCIGSLGGAYTHEPAESEQMSAEAAALVRAAHEGIDGARLLDHHVHVVGLGAGNTGTWVNPSMQSWLSPIRRLKFSVYAHASGVQSLEDADAQYMTRLRALAAARPIPGRYLLLAFDHHYGRDGVINFEKSEFYVPNAYVARLAEADPALFVPAMSVHPYRPDALAELEKWAARGMRVLKWLPNAMGIDPADPALDPFYDRMKQLSVTLLTHAGEEKAVEAEEDQVLGNPLKLRRPLERGVSVVVAHCASLGENEDLDDPARPLVANFELFMRLMGEARWQGQLFGEISAMTQANRLGDATTTVLERADLHPRLVNGSDYPLPAINVVIRMSPLVDGGWLTEAEAEALAEVYDYNPLLFDFVLKRTLHAPITGARFAPEVFYAKPLESQP
jgi:uncharacterized protein